MERLPENRDWLSSAEDITEDDALDWLEHTLPRTMRRLMDSENLELPLLQLRSRRCGWRRHFIMWREHPDIRTQGEAMGRLSERLGCGKTR